MSNDTEMHERHPDDATIAHIIDQLAWHWDAQARPRLDGLTDEEYLWEPVPGSWSLRPRSDATTAMAAGGGDWVADFEFPEPTPAPITTIAWRLGHVIVGVFGTRNAFHFDGPPMDYTTVAWPQTADAALALLDEVFDGWITGVRSMPAQRWRSPIGPAEGEWAEFSYEELVLHIHREAIHHLAEIALLRDLYAHR